VKGMIGHEIPTKKVKRDEVSIPVSQVKNSTQKVANNQNIR